MGLLWLLGAICDRLWFALDRRIPAWDQAEYLTGSLNYWRALQSPQWSSGDWWIGLWQLSAKIPPLVYLVTAPFLNLFGPGPDQSTLVNLLFSALLLGSVYALGSCLFSVSVGLWATGLCLLLPALYQARLDFLLDYPLAAMVTLCFACLTGWRQIRNLPPQEPIALPFTTRPIPANLCSWLLAVAFGLTLGLALMVKQPALMFLLVPTVWVGCETLGRREWQRLGQFALGLTLSLLVFGFWYRTNWLLMLTAGKRATIDSAIAEQDPSLLTLRAWSYYLTALPEMVSLPLLLTALIGFFCFWRRSRVSSQWGGKADFEPKPKEYQQLQYEASRRSLVWLLVFFGSGYLLSTLNINKDTRYVVPYLPVVAIGLAYGISLLPRSWRLLKWGAIGLSGGLMLFNLSPLGATVKPLQPRHPAYVGESYPHAQVVAEVIKAVPYLRSTIGVLPSTSEVNQHNLNYFGNLRNFQVYGRQVGTRRQFIDQDSRSLDWFLTKTDNQGSIRGKEAQAAIVRTVEQSNEFRLHKSWKLPDRSLLKLYRRRNPEVTVAPLPPGDSGAEVRLEQVTVPSRSPAGKPTPVTYVWSGSPAALQSGLVLLTWYKQGTTPTAGSDRWFHDHGLGLGELYVQPSRGSGNPRYRVTEQLAMLPPAAATDGTYVLQATYLDRKTGKTRVLKSPAVRLQLNPTAPPLAAPELDLSTQLRTMAVALPQGMQALTPVFDEIGRINQYDPDQDYVTQTRQAMEYRLQQEPNNPEFAYIAALANVLKRRVNPAIAALQRVTQLDPKNPNAYAYLAFVNLYDFRSGAAQEAINKALSLNPKMPELQALNAVAALMQGNPIRAWNLAQVYREMNRG